MIRRFWFLLSLVSGVICLSACSVFSGPNNQPTLVPTIQMVNSTIARVPTPRQPTSTAEPNAPVWVANPADHNVLRIDPATNRVAASIAIDGQPATATVGEGAVWVLDRQNNRVYHIDPSKNRISATIQLPEGTAESLAVGNGSVWVGMTGKIDLAVQKPNQAEDMAAPGMVVRIDPATNRAAEQLSVQPVAQILVRGDLLWVLSRTVIDTPVQVLDLQNHQGMAVPLRNAPEWLPAEAMAVGESGLWLFSSAQQKIYHAAADGRVFSTIDLQERAPSGYADLLLTGSGLWAATPWGSVLHIDPASNHVVANIELNVPLTRLIDGGETLWALSQQSATLFRIDPQSATVTAQIGLGSPLAATVVPSPTPRVVVWKPCPDAANSRLKIGDLAYVTKDPPLPNRVRKEPKSDAEIEGYINPGASMEILEGPICANKWVWWRVKNADLNGWTAEGDHETYWLVPLFP